MARFRDDSSSPLATRNVDVELEIKAASPDANHLLGSGAKDLRLFRNGLLIKTWTGDVLNGAKSRTLRASVPIVAGENRFSAYAFNNDDVKSLDANLRVQGADSLKRRGAAYLLVIGVEEYENPEYNLRYPVADAVEMGLLLRSQQERLARYQPTVTIPLQMLKRRRRIFSLNPCQTEWQPHRSASAECAGFAFANHTSTARRCRGNLFFGSRDGGRRSFLPDSA